MPTTVSPVAPPLDPFRLDAPPTARLVVLAALVAVAGDLALQAGVAGAAGAVAVAVTALALLRSGRLDRPAARALVAAAPVFGTCLALRTSPWLVPLDVVAAGGLLLLGASLARSGSLRDLPPVAIVIRAAAGFANLVWAPALLRFEHRPVRAGRWRSVALGAALAVPVVLVLGALLASADAVFASIFDLPGLRGDRIAAHLAGLVVAGWAALGLLRVASATAPSTDVTVPKVVGPTEATIVLGAVATLFGLFVTTQVVTALGGADHVLSTEGLTRAEYARSGFFQLLWVAGLTISGLLALAHVAVLDGVRRCLAGVVVALAVVIVAVAVVRLGLYRDAYGWTMLRLGCTAFAAWLGVVLVLLGVALAGPAAVRRIGWFVPAAGAAGLVVLLALNVANPEAMVARYNLTRDAAVAVDTDYLDHLSDDAVPTIASLLSEDDARRVLGCERSERRGWASWNRAASRADAARRRVCQA